MNVIGKKLSPSDLTRLRLAVTLFEKSHKAAADRLLTSFVRGEHELLYWGVGPELRRGDIVALYAPDSKYLPSAERKRIMRRNEAKLVDGKPKGKRREDVGDQCWDTEDVRAFLSAAREAGALPSAFYSTALETGMRKAELCGLRWKNLDLDAGVVRVVEQLRRPGPEPVFAVPKRGKFRTIDLSSELVGVLTNTPSPPRRSEDCQPSSVPRSRLGVRERMARAAQ